MRSSPHSAGRHTRWLIYGLLGFCTGIILFGPQIAEFTLTALGCAPGLVSNGAQCGGLASLIAQPLAPLLSAIPPVETFFVLIEQFWVLLAAWVILLVMIRHRQAGQADANSQQPPPAPPTASDQPMATRPSLQSQQAEWVRAKQAEQAADELTQQRSLRQRLAAEGLVWGAVGSLWWALFIGLIGFCIAFGTPLLGGLSADAMLKALGCSGHGDISIICVGDFGTYWIERLAPYRQPFFGALLSPIWLFTQFHDLLLMWLGTLILLALAPLYRFGWIMLAKQDHPFVVYSLFALSGFALLALIVTQFFGLTVAPSAGASSGGHTAPAVSFLLSVAELALVLLAVLTASLISLLIWWSSSSRKKSG